MERTALVPTAIAIVVRAHRVGMMKRATLVSIAIAIAIVRGAHRVGMMKRMALMIPSIII